MDASNTSNSVKRMEAQVRLLDCRQELRRRNVQRASQLHKNVQGGVAHATLEATEICPIDVGVMREGLLGRPV